MCKFICNIVNFSSFSCICQFFVVPLHRQRFVSVKYINYYDEKTFTFCNNMPNGIVNDCAEHSVRHL